MKKSLEIIKIILAFVIGIVILVYMAKQTTNKETSNTIPDEDILYKLQEDIEDLKEENQELKTERDSLKLDLKNAQEYNDELCELLEEHGIYESTDVVLTDGASEGNT